METLHVKKMETTLHVNNGDNIVCKQCRKDKSFSKLHPIELKVLSYFALTNNVRLVVCMDHC